MEPPGGLHSYCVPCCGAGAHPGARRPGECWAVRVVCFAGQRVGQLGLWLARVPWLACSPGQRLVTTQLKAVGWEVKCIRRLSTACHFHQLPALQESLYSDLASYANPWEVEQQLAAAAEQRKRGLSGAELRAVRERKKELKRQKQVAWLLS